jgi:hypothetical protein
MCEQTDFSPFLSVSNCRPVCDTEIPSTCSLPRTSFQIYISLFMRSDWHCTRKNAYRTHHRYYSGFWCLAGQIGQFLPCILEKRRVHRWGCERLPHQIGGWKCNRGGRFHFAFFTFSVTSIFKKKCPLNHKARGMNRGWVWMEDMEGPGLF